MRLSQLRDFLSILEAGSVRGAARRLDVSQPALTKSLRQLELELGIKLFQRTPTGVIPTRFGKALSVRARSVRAELRKAEEELGKLAGDERGSVAFGVGTVVTVVMVPQAIRQFRTQFPQARVRIMEGLPHVLLPLVRDETLDLVVGARPSGPIDSVFHFRPLFRSPRAVVARKGHPLANAGSLTELASADWLGLPPFGHWSETQAPLTPRSCRMPGNLSNATRTIRWSPCSPARIWSRSCRGGCCPSPMRGNICRRSRCASVCRHSASVYSRAPTRRYRQPPRQWRRRWL